MNERTDRSQVNKEIMELGAKLMGGQEASPDAMQAGMAMQRRTMESGGEVDLAPVNTFPPAEQQGEAVAPAEDAPEVAQAGEEEQAGEPEEKPSGDGDGMITAVNDLHSVLGITQEQFYDMDFNLSEDRTVKFGEIKDMLQGVDAEKLEIESTKAQLAQRQEEFNRAIAEKAGAVQKLTERQEKARDAAATIQAQYRIADAAWKEMREKDPGRVALEQQEFQNAWNNIQGELQGADHEARQMTDQSRQADLQKQHETLLKGDPRFPALSAVEGWETPEARAKVQLKIRKTAASYGVTDAELNSLSDARTLRIILDAAAWQEHQASLKETTKAMRGVPRKPIPRTGRLTQGEGERTGQLNATIEAARKPGAKSRDKMAAYAALGEKMRQGK